MKKNIFKFILIFIFVYFIGIGSVYAADIDFKVGKYFSGDGKHSITISSDNTVKYDDTYSLTLNKKTNGDTITGKIGTNNKSVTFYQLNESNIMTSSVLNYTYDGETVYLYDYTVFSLDKAPVEDENGKFELWHNGSKVKAYADLQSAVDAAVDGDTIKLTSDLSIDRGTYFNGKNLIIDGGNHTLTRDNWLNSLFVVEEGTTLTINNLIIEGGSVGFLVDYEKPNVQTGKSTSIPIKTGSDTSDIKLSFSPVISKGDLTFNNSQINNNYVNGNGGAINVVSGSLSLSDSKFIHNRSSNGGALFIGSNFMVNQTDYSINDILINNCEFNGNYSGNGASIYVYNTENTIINNSKFIKNTTTGGKGGAILINNQNTDGYWSIADKYNLKFPQFVINSSLFEENWVGNDGSAIENHEAELFVKDCIFRKNVGIHSSSSIGTISYYMSNPIEKKKDFKSVIDNCLFEENIASASTIGDHGSDINIDIINCTFKKNLATYNSMLFYSSDVNIKNCLFEDEIVSRGVIDIQSGYSDRIDGSPTVTFENVTFKNTKNGSTDIIIRKRNGDLSNPDYNVVFKGKNEANVNLWHENNVQINGEFIGNIETDSTISDDDLIINDEATVNGNIINGKDKVLVTLIYQDIDVLKGYNWEARKYVYADEKVYTKDEFYLEHQISKNGYELVLYTDNSYTTLWDYTVSKDKVDVLGSLYAYGRWEEHTHSYNDYVVYENALYEQCDCGYLGKKLDLVATDDLYENSNKKEVSIINELGIDENKIKVTYKKLVNNKWTDIEDIPSSVGNYKAVLTYENYEIEEEFTILKREVNPNTIDNITGMIISLIISICFIVISVNLLKKRYN